MPTDKLSTSSPEHAGARQAVFRLSIAAAVLLWAAWGARIPQYAPDDPPHQRCCELAYRVDPNTDSWWKIAALPGIGMVKAKRIVSFRSRVRVAGPFVEPDDLKQIHGIGPKTVARIAPMLRLGMDGTARQEHSGAAIPKRDMDPQSTN